MPFKSLSENKFLVTIFQLLGGLLRKKLFFNKPFTGNKLNLYYFKGHIQFLYKPNIIGVNFYRDCVKKYSRMSDFGLKMTSQKYIFVLIF